MSIVTGFRQEHSLELCILPVFLSVKKTYDQVSSINFLTESLWLR